ncbi:hypothetical protein [Streptomyces sp. JW3]|uniref:hypothetical protein n=1 Tax=Streptomyces sp. JW3 TaxID=3456955 RepID=UPI003FA4666F
MFDKGAGEFLAPEEKPGIGLAEREQTGIGGLGGVPFPVFRVGLGRRVRARARVSRPLPDQLPFPLVAAAGTDVGKGDGQAGELTPRRGRGQRRDPVVGVAREIPVGGTAGLLPQFP